MYLDDALLYNQGYMISINDLDSPLFYLFDYDFTVVQRST